MKKFTVIIAGNDVYIHNEVIEASSFNEAYTKAIMLELALQKQTIELLRVVCVIKKDYNTH